MQRSFIYKKSMLIVFMLMFSGSLCAMGDDEQIMHREVSAELSPVATEDSSNLTFAHAIEKAKQWVGDVKEKVKSFVDSKNDENKKPVETNTEVISAPESIDDSSENNAENVLQESTVEPTKSDKLFYFGGTVLGLTVLGGITYILHKKGYLARIEKKVKNCLDEIAQYPLLSTATVAGLFGMLFGYMITNH